MKGKSLRRKGRHTPSSPVVFDIAQRSTRLSQSTYITVALLSSEIVVPELLGHLLIAEQSNPGF